MAFTRSVSNFIRIPTERQEDLENEFESLCKPLNSWLQKNFHPHTRIIIEFDRAEIVESYMATPFEVKN